jgi:predicted membrane protein
VAPNVNTGGPHKRKYSLRADLSGSWKKSVQVTIAGGVGKISVLVPTSVGARVTVTTGLGSVTVNGLQKDGDSWVNAAYGTSPVTLDVTIKAGVGEVTLDAK